KSVTTRSSRTSTESRLSPARTWRFVGTAHAIFNATPTAHANAPTATKRQPARVRNRHPSTLTIPTRTIAAPARTSRRRRSHPEPPLPRFSSALARAGRGVLHGELEARVELWGKRSSVPSPTLAWQNRERDASSRDFGRSRWLRLTTSFGRAVGHLTH